MDISVSQGENWFAIHFCSRRKGSDGGVLFVHSPYKTLFNLIKLRSSRWWKEWINLFSHWKAGRLSVSLITNYTQYEVGLLADRYSLFSSFSSAPEGAPDVAPGFAINGTDGQIVLYWRVRETTSCPRVGFPSDYRSSLDNPVTNFGKVSF